MTYELTIPLKRGSVEIEFEDAEDLERKLTHLDVARVEHIVTAALRRTTTGARTPAKEGSKRKGAKRR